MGKYRYKHLPTIVKNLPDFFLTSKLFQGFAFISSYIYDLLILSKGDWKYHIQKLEITQNKLKQIWLKINTENYFFGKTKMGYLGLWVTCEGFRTLR